MISWNNLTLKIILLKQLSIMVTKSERDITWLTHPANVCQTFILHWSAFFGLLSWPLLWKESPFFSQSYDMFKFAQCFQTCFNMPETQQIYVTQPLICSGKTYLLCNENVESGLNAMNICLIYAIIWCIYLYKNKLSCINGNKYFKIHLTSNSLQHDVLQVL